MYDKMGCSGVWLLQEVLVKRNIVAMMIDDDDDAEWNMRGKEKTTERQRRECS